MVLGNQRGLNPQGEGQGIAAFSHALGHGQKLHAVAKLVGVIHIHALQATDAVGGNGSAIHVAAEGQGGQDRDLVGRVKTVYIRCRIGFGVAQLLGIIEHRVIGGPLLSHAGEDVVRGAVDDAANAVDAVAPQGLLQRLNDGNAATNGGLDQHVHPGGGRGFSDFLTVARDHGLVGGHHGFAGCNCLENQAAGRLQATDHLHHHVHGWVLNHRRWVGGQQAFVQGYGPGTVQIADGNTDQLQFTHQRVTFAGVLEDRSHSTANRAKSQQTHADLCCHPL